MNKINKGKIIQFFWLTTLLGLLVCGIVFFSISKFMLPDTEELENPKYEIATEIISADNVVLGKAFKLNREWVTYDELNPEIVKALVATEDERYFQHSGIDIRGLIRAVVHLGRNGGASTITQQLAKQFFTKRSSSFIPRVWQKMKEWVIAIEFERRYTKGEIIAMYLNKYDFIYTAIGIGSAAKVYFGKDQKDLTTDEAAVLVGMLKNPYYYNPKVNPDNAARRKRIVLNQMKRSKFLTEQEVSELSEKPIDLSSFKTSRHYKGLAPHFRAALVEWTKKLLEDPAYFKSDGTKYGIYTDGLKIYTTIDSRIQKHAESATQEHMSVLQERYFNRVGNRDPWTDGISSTQKKKRNGILMRNMRESERFKRMRSSYMSKITSRIYKKFPDARLWDTDIFRLFNGEDNLEYFDGLVSRKSISSQQAKTYKSILSSDEWTVLKKQWQALRNKSDKVFNTKTKIRLYDYKTGGEKTVTMTPLDSIKYMQSHLQIGSVALDSHTGHVKSWVGGINHKYFQYDHVRSNNQVGSTFKPFIYSTAIIDQAMSPCQKVQDVKYCITAGDGNFNLSKSWCPDNSNKKNTGEWLTLMEALKQSKNSVSVYLMKQIGNTERVRSLVANLGIDPKKIKPYPSMALGTPELSALDMATAYTAFANNGTLSKPIFVSKIEDKNGKVIYRAVPEQKKVIPPAYNHAIVKMLRYVASPIQSGIKSPVAGKTGTTDDYKDGWFVGFSPELVISTWVGGDMEFIRFTSIGDGAGSKMARPVFAKMMKKIEADKALNYDSNSQFIEPEKQILELDCSKFDQIIQSDIEQAQKNNDEFEEEFEEEF